MLCRVDDKASITKFGRSTWGICAAEVVLMTDIKKMRLVALAAAFAVFGVMDLLLLLVTPAPERGWALVPPVVSAIVVVVTLPFLFGLFERQQERIERQRREIETLHAMDTAIASEMDINRLLGVAVRKAVQAVDGEAGGIALFDQMTGRLEAEAYHTPDISEEERPRFQSMVRGGAGLASKRPDDYYETLCVPLTWSEQASSEGEDVAADQAATTRGYLVVARRRPGRAFAEYETRLLHALSGTVIVAVTNARALAQVRAANQLREELERERRVARALTEGLLPDVPPRAGRWAFSMRYEPQSAEAQVGGDIYDFFSLGAERWGVVIADVSGKGLAAARKTAMVKYALRSYAREHDSPAEVLANLNNALFDEPDMTGFVTLIYGVLDDRDGAFTYASAGHEPPILRRANGDFETLEPTGLVLGAAPGMPYEEAAVHLRRGDGMLLFTDGLSEARTPEGAFLDEAGVMRELTMCKDCAPDEVADKILAAVRAYSNNRLTDDTALLWIECAEPAPDLLVASHHELTFARGAAA